MSRSDEEGRWIEAITKWTAVMMLYELDTEARRQWHRLMFWAPPFLLGDNDMPTSESHRWLLVSFDSETDVINDG